MQTKNKFPFVKCLIMSGALVAFHIGSGFASGQEVLQFFTVFGAVKSLVGLLLAFFVFTFSSFFIIERFRKAKNLSGKMKFDVICSPFFSKVIEKITPILLFSMYTVTLSGTGALLQQLFGIKAIFGGALMAILATATTLGGLEKLVDTIGKMGFLVLFCVLILGIVSIINRPQALFENYDTLFLKCPKAAPNGFISSVIYAGFGTFTAVVFLFGLSAKVQNRKQALFVSFLGNGAYVLGAVILNLGLLASFEIVYNCQIPALAIANEILPKLAMVYALAMFAGAYTTAVPLLWSVCAALEKDEKNVWYKIFCICASAVAVVLGGFPFNKLLNICYPVIGVFGVLLIIDMVIKYFKDKNKPSEQKN